MGFLAAGRESTGVVHDVNQDGFCVKVAETDSGNVAMVLVCDGMGGLSKGELASATVIRGFSRWFANDLPPILASVGTERDDVFDQVKQEWGELIEQLNVKLAAYGAENGLELGTTLSALFVWDGHYLLAHVGDSRVYLLSGGRACQLTRDQTLMARELEQGHITLEEAVVHPQRNMLLQCIGCTVALEPDYSTGEVEEGMTFLLCTDGFCHNITSDEIYHLLDPVHVADINGMGQALEILIKADKTRDEQDDISAIAFHITEGGE